MTTLADKVSNFRRENQSIADTVTFSGADISVIAFRDTDPIIDFTVDSLNKELEKAQADVDRAYKNYIETEGRLAAAQANLQVEQIKIDKLKNGLIEGSTAFTRLNEREGKYIKQVQTIYAELERAQDNYFAAEGARFEIQKELDSLSKNKAIFFKLGSIHTISYSSFREKFAVRGLGRTQAKTYTRGPRTIAGTMVFNVFQEHEFLKMASLLPDQDLKTHPYSVMIDQIQPFNLLLLFANEYGAYSAMSLFNIDIASEGQEMSIDQILTHNTMNFYATEMVPMMKLGNRFNTYDEMIAGAINEIRETGLSSTYLRIPQRQSIDRFKTNTSDILSKSRGLF